MMKRKNPAELNPAGLAIVGSVVSLACVHGHL
jgi:hypothetical protein